MILQSAKRGMIRAPFHNVLITITLYNKVTKSLDYCTPLQNGIPYEGESLIDNYVLITLRWNTTTIELKSYTLTDFLALWKMWGVYYKLMRDTTPLNVSRLVKKLPCGCSVMNRRCSPAPFDYQWFVATRPNDVIHQTTLMGYGEVGLQVGKSDFKLADELHKRLKCSKTA